MGVDVKNHYLIPHWQSGTRQGVKFRVHKSNAQVDVTSTECTAAQWDDLEDKAAVSQAAFNTSAVTAWGDDYDDLVVADKAELRALFQAGLP